MNEFYPKILKTVRLCPAVSASFLSIRTAKNEVLSGVAVGCPACPALFNIPYVTRVRVASFIAAVVGCLNSLGSYFLSGQAGQIKKDIGFALVLLSGSRFNSRTEPDTAGQGAL